MQIKNKIITFILTFTISIAYCQSKNDCSPDKTITGFVYPPIGSTVWKNKISDTLKKEVTLIFESGFKDTLIIYFNNKIIKKDFYESDFSTSYTGKQVSIDYSKIKKKNPFFTIKSISSQSCAVIEIKRGYRLIELARVNGIWKANFSNYPPYFE